MQSIFQLLNQRISIHLRPYECKKFISKAFIGSGVGLGISIAARDPVRSQVSCDTSVVDHESTSASLRNYLNSASCQQRIEEEVWKRIKPATDAAWYEIEKRAKTEVEQALTKMVPEHVQHAKNEVRRHTDKVEFPRQVDKGTEEVKKAAKEVNDRIWWDIQKWVQAEVNKRIAVEVRRFMASDSNIQRIVRDHIIVVRAEISRTAEQVLREVAEEDRYQQTNNVVLAELRRRSDDVFDQNRRRSSEILEQINRDTAKAVKKIETAVDARVEEGIDKASKHARISQLMGLVAIGFAATAFYPLLKK